MSRGVADRAGRRRGERRRQSLRSEGARDREGEERDAPIRRGCFRRPAGLAFPALSELPAIGATRKRRGSAGLREGHQRLLGIELRWLAVRLVEATESPLNTN